MRFIIWPMLLLCWILGTAFVGASGLKVQQHWGQSFRLEDSYYDNQVRSGMKSQPWPVAVLVPSVLEIRSKRGPRPKSDEEPGPTHVSGYISRIVSCCCGAGNRPGYYEIKWLAGAFHRVMFVLLAILFLILFPYTVVRCSVIIDAGQVQAEEHSIEVTKLICSDTSGIVGIGAIAEVMDADDTDLDAETNCSMGSIMEEPASTSAQPEPEQEPELDIVVMEHEEPQIWYLVKDRTMPTRKCPKCCHLL